MGPIQVVVEDGNNLVLEVTPTPDTTVILDRGIAGPPGPMGDGDVDGPASSTDNAVARFDGTTGKVIQNSNVTIDDSGNLTYSAGTANGVAYLNGSKVLTTGSALTFDGTNFKTTGYAKAGGFTVAAGTLTAFDAASGGLYSYYSSGGVLASYSDNSGTLSPLNFDGSYLAWRPAGTEGMRLTSTGLGIGTSSPGVKLDVVGADGNGLQYRTSTRTIGIGSVSGVSTLYAGSGTEISFDIGGERMRLDSSGNLGIGTSSPAFKLDVDGQIRQQQNAAASYSTQWLDNTAANGYTQFVMRVGTSGANGQASINYAPGIFFALGPIVNDTTTPIVFRNNNATEQMRLDASGNLGLGVTPSAWFSTWKAIQVGASASLASRTDVFGMLLSQNAVVNAAGNNAYIGSGAASQYGQIGGEHRWLTAPSGTAGDAISFTQAATLTANGEYLVGLTSATGVAKLQVSGPLQTTGYTVATLPAGTVGMRTYVTDALVPVALATVAGGGSVVVPVFYNGSNWIVA